MTMAEKKGSGCGSVGCGLLLVALLGIPAYHAWKGAINPQATPTAPTAPQAVGDEYDRWLDRFGSPDVLTSSEDEKPKPLMLSKILTYKKENVKVVFMQGHDNGDNGFYFVRCTDRRNKSITPTVAVSRLQTRDKGK
jgi:hypothetical protein